MVYSSDLKVINPYEISKHLFNQISEQDKNKIIKSWIDLIKKDKGVKEISLSEEFISNFIDFICSDIVIDETTLKEIVNLLPQDRFTKYELVQKFLGRKKINC